MELTSEITSTDGLSHALWWRVAKKRAQATTGTLTFFPVLAFGIFLFFASSEVASACICGNDCEIIGDCCVDCGTGNTWCSTNCSDECCRTNSNGTHTCGPSMCSDEIQAILFDPVAHLRSLIQPIQAAPIRSDRPSIQVEIQDKDTSLVQDLDPTKSHLQVTSQLGNRYQVLSFDKGELQKKNREAQERNAAECALVASLTCGEGNVSSVTYENHIFWSCCDFTCGIPEPE